MKFQLIIRPEAEIDIEESYNWYEDQATGLGDEFLLALQMRLRSVIENPFTYQKIHTDVRRAVISRFPHAIFYFVSEEKIFVIACVHHKRDPRTWQDR